MKFTAESIALGHLPEAIFHLNAGLVQQAKGRGAIDVSRSLSDCLNKLQTTWGLQATKMPLPDEKPPSETAKFQQLVKHALSESDGLSFLHSTELARLAALTPLILNHQTLTTGKYQPGVPLDNDLAKKAALAHYKLKLAIERFQSAPCAEFAEKAITHTATLLYVVRSNINHGEKTPFGPDHAKRGRDQQVCQVIIPVQSLLIDLLLGKPSTKLVVYGSLAPGQANHEILEGIQGTWRDSTVQGSVSEDAGLKMLRWAPGSEPVGIHIFESDELPNLWAHLDAFEGSRYVRQVVTVGGTELANAYVSADIDS